MQDQRHSHAGRAIVTGAGNGIGRAFALEMAREGGSALCHDDHLPAME